MKEHPSTDNHSKGGLSALADTAPGRPRRGPDARLCCSLSAGSLELLESPSVVESSGETVDPTGQTTWHAGLGRKTDPQMNTMHHGLLGPASVQTPVSVTAITPPPAANFWPI